MELGERQKMITEDFAGLSRIPLQIFFFFELAVTDILRHMPVQ